MPRLPRLPFLVSQTRVPDGQPFVPVVVGGDTSAYSIARAFHQAYGVVSAVVSTYATGPVAHSRIIENVVDAQMEDPQVLVRLLRELADRHTDTPMIVLGSADHLVRLLVDVRDQVEDRYVVPYVPVELMNRLTHKESFAQLCQQYGLPHPRTEVIDVTQLAPDEVNALSPDLPYPMIVKTSNSSLWHEVTFEGQQKVHTARDVAELRDLVSRVKASGYRGKLICQDMVPGDDQGMRILTCYSDRFGRVRFAAYGTVLLEEHTPTSLGNPAGIIAGSSAVVVDQARRLLEGVGWTGYANFDLKLDPRTGELVFFELNPRLGRSNFYVTSAGHNVTRPYVEEHVWGRDPFDGVDLVVSDTEHVYTIVPMSLLGRYVTDPATKDRLARLSAEGKVSHPLAYGFERDPRRLAYLWANLANQVRKFRRYYPTPGRPS